MTMKKLFLLFVFFWYNSYSQTDKIIGNWMMGVTTYFNNETKTEIVCNQCSIISFKNNNTTEISNGGKIYQNSTYWNIEGNKIILKAQNTNHPKTYLLGEYDMIFTIENNSIKLVLFNSKVSYTLYKQN